MTDFEMVTAADVQLMQGLAQRVTATRPDLISVGCGSPATTWWRGAGPFFLARSGALTGR
jgi:hypothetical protein